MKNILVNIEGSSYNIHMLIILNLGSTTVIWFIFVLKIISVFNFGGDLISFL